MDKSSKVKLGENYPRAERNSHLRHVQGHKAKEIAITLLWLFDCVQIWHSFITLQEIRCKCSRSKVKGQGHRVKGQCHGVK